MPIGKGVSNFHRAHSNTYKKTLQKCPLASRQATMHSSLHRPGPPRIADSSQPQHAEHSGRWITPLKGEPGTGHAPERFRVPPRPRWSRRKPGVAGPHSGFRGCEQPRFTRKQKPWKAKRGACGPCPRAPEMCTHTRSAPAMEGLLLRAISGFRLGHKRAAAQSAPTTTCLFRPPRAGDRRSVGENESLVGCQRSLVEGRACGSQSQARSLRRRHVTCVGRLW